jgi:hypothetical protein
VWECVGRPSRNGACSVDDRTRAPPGRHRERVRHHQPRGTTVARPTSRPRSKAARGVLEADQSCEVADPARTHRRLADRTHPVRPRHRRASRARCLAIVARSGDHQRRAGSPAAAGAHELVIAQSRIGDVGDAGVVLGVGSPAECINWFPDCGCDACDSGSQNELDHLDNHLLGIVTGRFRRLTKRTQTITVINEDRWSATNLSCYDPTPCRERARGSARLDRSDWDLLAPRVRLTAQPRLTAKFGASRGAVRCVSPTRGRAQFGAVVLPPPYRHPGTVLVLRRS